MKNLFLKELRLSTNVQLVIFVILSILLILVPDWPSMVSFIYLLFASAAVFPKNIANQDLTYTSSLPVAKPEIVRAKAFYIAFIEVFTLVASVPFAVVKIMLIDPYLVSTAETESDAAFILASEPNPLAYGLILVGFAVYNLILIPWIYKNPMKANATSNWAGLIGFAIYLVLIALDIGISILLIKNGMSAPVYYGIGCGVLAFGIILFLALFPVTWRLGAKHFEKVDL
jgi:hypothetical protein